MSEDNNISNETPKSKTNASQNEQDNITTNTNNQIKLAVLLIHQIEIMIIKIIVLWIHQIEIQKKI